MPTLQNLAAYWSAPEVEINIIISLNLLGALLLGLVVGYERSYHGRAAGMRTYGLVCMASAALTVLAGYPAYWYAGHALPAAGADPTRIIQGIVTGIGFLGAGVIMKEGFSISGLTTAASIWASSAIGVMIGIGFYAAAMLLALFSVLCMMWVSKLEGWLPTRQAVAMFVRFRKDCVPQELALKQMIDRRGYDLADGTVAIALKDGQTEWHFVAIARAQSVGAPLSELAEEVSAFAGVESYQLSYAKN